MDNIVTVSVLVFRGDSILFVKASQEGSNLRLTLPGGRLRDLENIEECGARGVSETAGISIVLEKRLSGVITRRSNQGNLLVTFVFLAEVMENMPAGNNVFIPFTEVERYSEISEFSKLIVRNIKDSKLMGMDRSEFIDAGGREYLMFF